MLKTTVSCLPLTQNPKQVNYSLVNLASMQLALPFPTSAVQKPPKLVLHFIIKEITYYMIFFQGIFPPFSLNLLGMTILIRILDDFADDCSIQQPEVLALSHSENALQVFKDFELQLRNQKDNRKEIMRIIYYILIIYLRRRKQILGSNALKDDDKFYLKSDSKYGLEGSESRKALCYAQKLALTCEKISKLTYETKLAITNFAENSQGQSLFGCLNEPSSKKKTLSIPNGLKGASLSQSLIARAKTSPNEELKKSKVTSQPKKLTQESSFSLPSTAQIPIHSIVQITTTNGSNQFALIPYSPIQHSVATQSRASTQKKQEKEALKEKNQDSSYLNFFRKYLKLIKENPRMQIEDNGLSHIDSTSQERDMILLNNYAATKKSSESLRFKNPRSQTLCKLQDFSRGKYVCPPISSYRYPGALTYPNYRFFDMQAKNCATQELQTISQAKCVGSLDVIPQEPMAVKINYDHIAKALQRRSILTKNLSTFTFDLFQKNYLKQLSLTLTTQSQSSKQSKIRKTVQKQQNLALTYQKVLALPYEKMLALPCKETYAVCAEKKLKAVTYPKVLSIPYEKVYSLPYEKILSIHYVAPSALTYEPRLALPYETRQALLYEVLLALPAGEEEPKFQ